MARWTKRACVFNEELQRWISPTTGKSYSIEQYERLCETGRKAAAVSKAIAEYTSSPEWQAEMDEIMACQEARKHRPMILPGGDGWDYGFDVRRARRRS